MTTTARRGLHIQHVSSLSCPHTADPFTVLSTLYMVYNGANTIAKLTGTPSSTTMVGTVASALAAPAVNWARDTLTTSLWTLGSTGIMAVGSQLLLSAYGGHAGGGILSSIHAEIQRFQKLRTPPHGQPEKQQQLAVWQRLGAAPDAQQQVQQLPATSLSVLVVLFGSLLTYMHTMGAYEIKGQLQANADARGADPSAGPSSAANGDPMHDEHFLRWYAAQIAPSQSAVRQWLTADGAASTDDDPDLVESKLRDIYTQHPFYEPKRPLPPGVMSPPSAEPRFVTAEWPHPVRVVINLMVGFALHVNALLGRKGSRNRSLRTVAQLVTLEAYWELFAHAIRLYGWSPVRQATRYVLWLLMSGQPQAALQAR